MVTTYTSQTLKYSIIYEVEIAGSNIRARSTERPVCHPPMTTRRSMMSAGDARHQQNRMQQETLPD